MQHEAEVVAEAEAAGEDRSTHKMFERQLSWDAKILCILCSKATISRTHIARKVLAVKALGTQGEADRGEE